MTIKDIARLSGYSIGTVSRVINQHPDVSETARKKILEIIERENFQPNSNAKHLKQSHSTPITIIVKGSSNLFLETLMEKTEQYLEQNGETSNVVFVNERDNEVRLAVQICTERNPKGIIFLGGALENFRRDFRPINVPCVLISGWAKDLGYKNLSSFTTNDYDGARQAAKLLTENGHRRFLIIGGYRSEEADQVSSQRLNGFLSVLREKNIPFDQDTQYVETMFTMEDGYEKAYQALQRFPDTTAVFGLSDLVAVGIMRAAHDLGKNIPEDLSVVGYDGIAYTGYTVPRLTTIRQNIERLVSEGVDDLLFRISYKKTAAHKQITADPVLHESIRDLNR
ncbi:MAG: LacI family DNA-binding transcriptional regulator [Erysipelotrichaceae bacterium]|nr:LacI family DNA-binding transcriptional regulator [Erysipelotrichaceae bacterium]